MPPAPALHSREIEPSAHQRFVNTTPKPRATKKSRGDEPCPLPPFPLPCALLSLPPLLGGVVDVGASNGVLEVEEGKPVDARVGSGDEVAEEMAVVAAWRISCWRVRTATLARPARSRLSKAMAAKGRNSGLWAHKLELAVDARLSVCCCGCGGWAQGVRGTPKRPRSRGNRQQSQLRGGGLNLVH